MPLIIDIKSRQACVPSSAVGVLTVVSAGAMASMKSMSFMPTIEISSGHVIFCARKCRRHPTARMSMPATDGPQRGELAEGKPVLLAEGRAVDPEDVLGPLVAG